jgi:hypothetical protein
VVILQFTPSLVEGFRLRFLYRQAHRGKSFFGYCIELSHGDDRCIQSAHYGVQAPRSIISSTNCFQKHLVFALYTTTEVWPENCAYIVTLRIKSSWLIYDDVI